MRGSEWVQSLPLGAEREEAIVAAALAGHYPVIEWQPFEVVVGVGSTQVLVRYWASADVLKLGDEQDAVRVNVSARSAQRIATGLGCLLPTTKIVDRLYLEAKHRGIAIDPQLQPVTLPERLERYGKDENGQPLSPSPADNMAMLVHDRAVELESRRVPAAAPRLISNAGKDWVLTNVLLSKPPGTAANYGWFSDAAPYRTASGLKAWQQLGTRHNLDHCDYSQTLRLVRSTVTVDGEETSFVKVATDPNLWRAVSDEGPLRLLALDLQRRPPPPPPAPSSPGFDEEPPTTVTRHPLASAFKQSRHYTRADRSGMIKHVVIHTAEIAELPTSAEALMNWAAGPNAARASWHFAVDSDTITQSVLEKHIAWHAPGANQTGIGIELCGRARQTPAEWEDDYSRAVLEHAARLTASLCAKWKIPLRVVYADGLVAGLAGITTHAEVTRAFRKSTHTDPGPHFPMARFLARVRELHG